MPKLRTPRRQNVFGQASHLTDPWRNDLPAAPIKPGRGPSLYFIDFGDHVMIGRTIGSPRARFAGMDLPPDARLAAVIPNCGPDGEAEIRERFRRYRTNGKWFRRCPELEALMKAFAV